MKKKTFLLKLISSIHVNRVKVVLNPREFKMKEKIIVIKLIIVIIDCYQKSEDSKRSFLTGTQHEGLKVVIY